jgi:esterase FrsA
LTLYRRPYQEVREILLQRARLRRNPMEFVPESRAAAILDRLQTLDRDAWASAFIEAAQPFWEAGLEAEAVGDLERARQAFLDAYGLFRVARYPAPNSPKKLEAYRWSQLAYLRHSRLGPHPVERVTMPYVGRLAPPESVIIGYLRKPERAGPVPLVIQWGGIDSFKEDRHGEIYLEEGWAVLAVDMPGVGDAPIPGSEQAEELWTGIFEWVRTRPDLDARRVAVVGASTGGYWATKLAHTHRQYLAAAVNHGGPTHHAFQPDWIRRAAQGEYPFELAETLASAFGRSTAEEWLEYAPRLSLLEQGVLDQPCAPLLCLNGVEDSIFPIQDMYLLLEHGAPKVMRLYPGGHMGHHPDLFPTLVTWLRQYLNPPVARP